METISTRIMQINTNLHEGSMLLRHTYQSYVKMLIASQATAQSTISAASST